MHGLPIFQISRLFMPNNSLWTKVNVKKKKKETLVCNSSSKPNPYIIFIIFLKSNTSQSLFRQVVK